MPLLALLQRPGRPGAAAGGIDGEMLRRVKMIGEFTRLRDELGSTDGSPSAGPAPTAAPPNGVLMSFSRQERRAVDATAIPPTPPLRPY